MRRYRVHLTEKAITKIEYLKEFFIDKAGHRVGSAYIAGLHAYCKTLSTSPMRGRNRDDDYPRLRIVNYKGRIDVAMWLLQLMAVMYSFTMFFMREKI